VYNIGGGKENAASVLEIIDILKSEYGLELNYSYDDRNRQGDHICYYTDMGKFKKDYPEWKITKGLGEIIGEIVERIKNRNNVGQ
jgi:CDP-paratose 2-epimerase